MSRLSIRVLICALSLALTFGLMAQTITGSIVGTVKDATGAPLPGASVSVSGATIVGSQTAVTNSEGFYRFINLPPGFYDVTFAQQGFQTLARKGLRVGVGTAVEVNADLAMSQMAEQIDVVADASVVDTRSNEVGANLDRNFVENIPTRRTSFFDLVATAPGSLAAGEGSGDHSSSTRTMVYGSSYDDNSFKLDGVDITDNYWGEALAEPNIDAIEEIQVLSLGAPAEYGNLQGAVYNIVTRQGTNDFHGDSNFFFQPAGLTSDNLKDNKNPNGTFVDACPTGADPNRRCPFNREKYHDFSAQLGGPLIKDKLWFFGSYQVSRDSFSQVGVDPIFVGLLKRDRFIGKLNWQLSPRHKLVGSFHLDKGQNDQPLSVGETATRAYSRFHKTPVPGIAYTGTLSDRTVLELRYSGFYGSVHGQPTDPNQPKNLPRITNYDTGVRSGGHYYFYSLDPYKRQTATAKLSHLADNFLGSSHDFRFGVQYSDGEVSGAYGLNDSIYIYYGYSYGYERTPWVYSGVGRATGVFLDDTVRVNDRLSLNLGVRYDRNEAFTRELEERINLETGNGTPTGVVFPRVDQFTWNSVSPRLGFNLKLTSDGKTVLKGHWGRYHRAVATGEFANRLGPSVTPAFSGSNYNFTTGQFESLVQTTSPEKASVKDGYFSPHTDQAILGIERELVRNVGVNLNYVYKFGDDMTTWETSGGVYEPVTYIDNVGEGATGRPVALTRLVNSRSDLSFALTNDPRMFIRVHAVSFGLLKHMSAKWSLNTSLTWLRSTGRLPQSREGVELRQLGGMQFREFGRDPNDYVNTDGRQRGDVEWQFKTQFVYQLPLDFVVSANVSHRDGAHLIRQAAVGNLTRLSSVVLLEKRGENGRLPSVTFVDARLEKNFKLGSRAKLAFSADAFNLFNEDANQRVRDSRVTRSTFNYPRDFVLPRRFLLGAKLKF